MASCGPEIDTITRRPRTPNDQYTVLTNTQVSNIPQQTNPFFRTVTRAKTQLEKLPKEGGRFNRDRYTATTDQHLLRGRSMTQPFGWIDHQWNRHPDPGYDTCRGRAAVRWGVNNQGERTRSHFFGESIDRYTTIDMYRRPATNYAGRVVMDCGRPGDGYYTQKYPSNTTWFGSTVPLNQTQILQSVYKKTGAQYDQIRAAERVARRERCGKWPEYSEFTDRYLMNTKITPALTGLARNKQHVLEATANCC